LADLELNGMNRLLHYMAFAVGLLTVAWVGAGYLPGSPLALALVALIGAFFLLGAMELQRFMKASATLARQLAATTQAPANLADWLAPLPQPLRGAVRLRVEGERVALPGPTLTPYVTGLLVLLGMLGTFLGMVVTLKGTGLALENASDVAAIRASLAAPVKGLGLAFGTSVAGVAASAMLGLMSALARRERQAIAQQLDACIATPLRAFSRAHQRDEGLRLLGAQADAMRNTLPALVGQIEGLVAQMERQGQALQAGLLAGQAGFHAETQRNYTDLADSVGRSLQASLGESARLASAAIEPAVQAAMAGLARQAATLRDDLGAAVQTQLHGTTARLEASTATLAQHWQAALADQQRHSLALTEGLSGGLAAFAQTFEQGSEALLASVAESQAAAGASAATREAERMQALQASLAAMAAGLAAQGEQQLAALADSHRQTCSTFERTAQAIHAQAELQARATVGEVTRLMDAAAQAPRAAAEVMTELRSALSASLARDNAMLEERTQLLGTLGQLLDGVNHASTEQRAAIDALVQATEGVLGRAGAHFTKTVDAQARSLQQVAAQVTGSAAEVASLGEGFGHAVHLFSGASEQLTTQLQRIEAALGQSMARSDEQLAYYVAQAREIIDLTLGSQKQIVEDLQQLAHAPGVARGVISGGAREVRA